MTFTWRKNWLLIFLLAFPFVEESIHFRVQLSIPLQLAFIFDLQLEALLPYFSEAFFFLQSNLRPSFSFLDCVLLPAFIGIAGAAGVEETALIQCMLLARNWQCPFSFEYLGIRRLLSCVFHPHGIRQPLVPDQSFQHAQCDVLVVVIPIPTKQWRFLKI